MPSNDGGHGSTGLALVTVVAVLVLAAVFSGVYLSSGPLQRTVTTTESSFQTLTTTFTTTSVSTTTTTSLSTTTTTSTAFVAVITQVITVEASSTYSSGGYSGGPVVQSCLGSATYVSVSSCTLGLPVTKGHLLVAELSDVPQDKVNDSLGSAFKLMSSAELTGSTYYIQVYVAVALSSGVDTFTATGPGNFPNLVVHELNRSSVASTSELSGDSASPSVGGYAPPAGSLVLGVVLAGNGGESVSPGQGQTFMGQYPGVIGDEYSIATGGQVTSPFVLSTQQAWGEVSVAFT